MKKIAILSALAICLGLTSCDDNDIIGIPQNAQQPVFEAKNLTMAATAEVTGKTVDLTEYNDANKVIPIVDVTAVDFPADYNLDFVMQISKDPSFGRFAEVETEMQGSVITVAPDDLQSAYYSAISKGPKAKDIYVRYAAYAVDPKNGANEIRIGNPDFYFAPGTEGYQTINILPFPSELVIEDHYYLLGTINDWSVANAIEFSHSAEGVYDDPVFSLKVDITPEQAASGWWWKIVPESTYVTGNWVDAPNGQIGVEVNGDESMSGSLAYMQGTFNDDGSFNKTFEPGAGCVKESGPMLFKINMEEGSYEISLAIEKLYTPGGANGWSQENSDCLFTTDYVNYAGYAHVSEFKFTSAPNWNGINYGFAEEGKLSTDGGAGNINAPAPGFCFVQANIASLTYSISAPVTTYGLIGGATPGGWDVSTALTPSANEMVWEGDVAMKGGEYKFRANDAWDINLGGSLDNLTQDAGNLMFTEPDGTYHVVLDLSTYPAKATFTKK